ncbi:MAG: TrkA family potassium uptake protein [Anaerotruncus sp.]|nr:TrkA family potassium uptake protein [Anaerotruncus sp.]
MNVIVVGGGKVGYYLTKTLLEHGHSPHLIEQNRESCSHIADELDIPVVCGDGSTIEVLDLLDARYADALIAVTGRDQDNLIACQLAKKLYQIPRTVARVNNPKNAAVMRQMGVDIPVSVTDNIAQLLEREIDTAAIRQLMSLNRGEATLSEVELPRPYALDGKRLSELDLPEESVIVSISRDGQMIIPRGNAQIFGGDRLVFICTNHTIKQFSQKLALKNP